MRDKLSPIKTLIVKLTGVTVTAGFALKCDNLGYDLANLFRASKAKLCPSFFNPNHPAKRAGARAIFA